MLLEIGTLLASTGNGMAAAEETAASFVAICTLMVPSDSQEKVMSSWEAAARRMVKPVAVALETAYRTGTSGDAVTIGVAVKPVPKLTVTDFWPCLMVA